MGTLSRAVGRRDLTSGPVVRNLLWLAAPVAVGMVLHALYNLVDAFWLGKWSKQALAAPGVSMPFFFFVIAFGTGLSTAGTALVAQHTGAGRHREADRAAAQTILLLCGLAVILGGPMLVLAPQLLRLARVPADVAPKAAVYLRILLPGLPLMAVTISYAAILRALGDTVTVVLIGVAANALNMVLDPVLIFGLAGAPSLGIGGAALATLTSQCIGAAACYALLRRHHGGLTITWADLRPDWPVLRKAFSVGLPVAVSNSVTSVGFAVFQTMINSLGTVVIGAFTIGFRVIHFFNVPSQAMAVAAAPVVGQALGAGKPALARRAVLVSAGLVAAVMFLPLAFLIWKGQLVARAFVNDPEVIAESRNFFLIVPASSYFFGVLMVLMAAFYGSGHTRPVMVLAILRLWVLRVPAGYLLAFVAGWGSRGVYAGMAIGNVTCALVAFWLFCTVRWQRAVVPTGDQQPEELPRTPAERAGE